VELKVGVLIVASGTETSSCCGPATIVKLHNGWVQDKNNAQAFALSTRHGLHQDVTPWWPLPHQARSRPPAQFALHAVRAIERPLALMLEARYRPADRQGLSRSLGRPGPGELLQAALSFPARSVSTVKHRLKLTLAATLARAPGELLQAALNFPARSVSTVKHRRPDLKVAALARNGVRVIGCAEQVRSAQPSLVLPGVAAICEGWRRG